MLSIDNLEVLEGMETYVGAMAARWGRGAVLVASETCMGGYMAFNTGRLSVRVSFPLTPLLGLAHCPGFLVIRVRLCIRLPMSGLGWGTDGKASVLGSER